MKDIKTLGAMMLYWFGKLAKFNAFAGVILGFLYSQIASVFDRNFLNLGAAQIMLMGIGVFVVSFGLSILFTFAANVLLSEGGEPPTN